MKKIISILIVLTTLLTGVYGCSKDQTVSTEKETSETVQPKCTKVINKTKTDVDDNISKIIKEYTNLYLDALINLKVNDVSDLFDDPDSNQAYLTNTALDVLIEHHLMQYNDLSLSKANYTLTYTSVKKNNDEVEVTFLENDTLRYKYLNQDTKQIDVENTIVLVKQEDDTYKIKSIDVVKDFYVLFTRNIDMSTKNVKEKIDQLKEKQLKIFKTNAQQSKDLIEEASANAYKTSKTYDCEYNREDAVTYAYKWVNKRNPEYHAYDNEGGNCMNFVSQCIHAGGIIKDYYGKDQWKFYDTTLNTKNEAKGRSKSWVATAYFYQYAKSNTGKGLVCDPDINLYYGEAGDVLQVGFDGKFTHSTIIVDQVKDNEGQVTDLILNSNTSGLKNAPMSTYLYNKRVIKILGYNK